MILLETMSGKGSELGKSFNISGKEIIAVLKDFGIEKKSTTSSLEDDQLNLLVEILTQKYDDGSPIDMERKEAEPVPEEKPAKVEAEPEKEEKESKSQRQSRHVDTRANAVDLKKYDECLPPKLIRARAFVKVQDGCDNYCSYCIIPYLRGQSRSRNPINIRREIELLSPKEVVLTGINLTSYNFNGITISKLVDMISDLDLRVRLGSLEENIITEEFLKSLSKLKDFAPHFHLSLQSGCDETLKRMNRRYTAEEFEEIVNRIRKYYQDAILTTDIIVGFPEQTDKEFNETLQTCSLAGFGHVHIFPYSVRNGTVAAKLKQVDFGIKKERDT